MPDDRQMLDLRDYVEVLSRRRGLVLLPVAALALLATLATGMLWAFRADSYESQADYLVNISIAESGESSDIGLTDLASQPFVLRSLPVAERVARELGLSTDEDSLWALTEQIEVNIAAEGAPVLSVFGVAETPELAVALPATFVEQYAKYQEERLSDLLSDRETALVEELRSLEESLQAAGEEVDQRQEAWIFEMTGVEPQSIDSLEELLALLLIRDGASVGASATRLDSAARTVSELGSQISSVQSELSRLRLADPAVDVTLLTPPTDPSTGSLADRSLEFLRNLVLASLLGLVGGTALALMTEWQLRPFVRWRDAERATGSLVLATIAGGSRSAEEGDATPADDYRTLRAVVQSVLACSAVEAGGPMSVMVTTPSDRATSSAVASDLAFSFARDNVRVALVGVALATGNGGSATTGKVEVFELEDGGEADQAPSLTVRLEQLLAQSEADLIVVHTPPVLQTGHAAEIGRLTSGALLVAEWGVTNLDDLEESRAVLNRAGCRVLGVVDFRTGVTPSSRG